MSNKNTQIDNILEDFDREVEAEIGKAAPLAANKIFGPYAQIVASSLNQYQCYQRHKHQQQEQEPSGIKVKLEEGSSSSPSSPSSLNTSSSSNLVQGSQDWHDSLKLACSLGTAILSEREASKPTLLHESTSMFVSKVAKKACISKMLGLEKRELPDSSCFISAIIISIFRNNKDLIGQYEEVHSSRNRTVYVDRYKAVDAADTWPVVRARSFLNKLEKCLQRSEHERTEVEHVDPWSAIARRLKKWGHAEEFLPTFQEEEFRNSITNELADGMIEIYETLKASVLDAHMEDLQDKTKQLLDQRESGKIRQRDSS